MSRKREPDELAKDVFYITMAGVGAFIVAGFFFIL